MGFIRSVVLYAGLTLGANAAVADMAEIEALRDGMMKKLVFHADPSPVSQVEFTDPAGGIHTMSDYKGKYVLLNFWATWCAPCRKEMPSLDHLQAEYGSDDFAVVTVATGRNTLAGINRFFTSADITNLPILLDPKSGFARDMGVLGLPITVILDPEGNEIARLRGDAEWDSSSAFAIIKALTTP